MSKELESLLSEIDKQFGKGAFFKVGDRPPVEIETTGSGSIKLDEALGKGYPKGRIIEVFGIESSGKTTITLLAAKEAQKKGEKVAFIDMEHALDLSYAKKLGVNTDDLFISQPDNGEQALEILDKVITSGQFGLAIFDSVAALVSKKELEGEMGDSVMGINARLMSQAMRKLTPNIQKTNTTVFFINQMRDKIGIVFGNPQTTTGGNALKYAASQRLEVKKGTQIKDADGVVIGHELNIKVVKNKVFPPFKEAKTKLLYGIGISMEDELVDISVEKGIIKKSGSWFSYGETKLGQGQNQVRDILQDNPELVQELLEKIK
jgi:recombination protein RecA